MSVIGYEADGRWGELIRRVTGNEEIVPPGFLLELDRPEWRIHKLELLWTTGRIPVAASAANNSRVQIFNPGTRRLVVCTAVIAKTTAAALVTLTIDAAAAATPAPNLALDTRVPVNVGVAAPTVQSINRIANNNAVISGYEIGQFACAAATPTLYTFPNPVILSDTHNLTFFDLTVNDAFTVWGFGYERPARPEEITI